MRLCTQENKMQTQKINHEELVEKLKTEARDCKRYSMEGSVDIFNRYSIDTNKSELSYAEMDCLKKLAKRNAIVGILKDARDFVEDRYNYAVNFDKFFNKTEFMNHLDWVYCSKAIDYAKDLGISKSWVSEKFDEIKMETLEKKVR